MNGHPIPFDMKIGDAGEAFFVFETEEDVPDELITSPLLQPTVVGPTDDRAEISSSSFSAKDGGESGGEETTAQLEGPALNRDEDVSREAAIPRLTTN